MSIALIALTVVVIVMITIGTLGIVNPRMPDIPLIWLGIFLFAAITQWEIIDLRLAFFFTLGMLVVVILDYLTMNRHYRPDAHHRSHIASIVAASLSGLIGGLIALPFGLFLGVLWGALLGELTFTPDRVFSYETKFYRVVGFVGTTLLKISIAVFMIGTFFQKLLTL